MLFGSASDQRLSQLFNSLQTSMIAKEAENVGGSPEKFMDKRESISFMVFSQRALRQEFAREVLFPFLGSKERFERKGVNSRRVRGLKGLGSCARIPFWSWWDLSRALRRWRASA